MAYDTNGSLDGHYVSDSTNPKRLLALEIRPRKTGFVVIEETTTLVDWGVRKYSDVRRDPGNALTRIAALFDLHSPESVVMRHRSGLPKERADIIRAIQHGICSEAKRRRIACCFIEAYQVREFFVHYGSKTKYGIASILAAWFDDLAWQLPAKRRAWQSEAHGMLLFDAAAAGVTYLRR